MVPAGGTDSAPTYPGSGDPEHPVIYADPELALEKTAENLARQDDWHLGDTVGYTVVLSNRRDPSMGYDAVLVDVMSDGLALDTSSLELTLPDGTVRRLSMDDVEFDAASNTLRVPVGDLAGGESATLTYRAAIREPSVPGKIVNSVSATATGEGGSETPDRSDGAADVLIPLSSARLPDTGASASAAVLYPVNGRFGLLGRMADEPAFHAALAVAAAAVAVALAAVWRRRHA